MTVAQECENCYLTNARTINEMKDVRRIHNMRVIAENEDKCVLPRRDTVFAAILNAGETEIFQLYTPISGARSSTLERSASQ